MSRTFAEAFGIPPVAEPYISLIFTEEEVSFVTTLETDGVYDPAGFSADEAERILGKDSGETRRFLQDCYRRGVLNLADTSWDRWKLNDFYGMLDVFVVSRQELYRTIPQADREAIDDWYFDTYCEGLDAESDRPTQDAIYTLEEMLALIDGDERPVYLNYCDCRSLRGDCGKPTRTCITYKNGINTFSHRGLSLPIDKERAKEIVLEADKAGLMHTANPNGICNCCSDCCYMFRGRRARERWANWPPSKYRVSFSEMTCVSCGKCTKRCPFGVFTKEEKHVRADISRCVGCGLCVTTCPAKALTLTDR